MKQLILIVILIFCSLSVQGEQYSYIESTAENREFITVNIQGTKIELDTADEYHTIFINNQMETLTWRTFDKESQKSFEISRTPELFTKDIPWYQTIHQLGSEVKKGNKKILFYITSNNFDKELSKGDGLQVMEFKAVYKKSEDDLDLYYITFNDYRSLFWKSKVWFRATDGVIIRYSSVRGAPGTPETVGVLNKIKELANIH